MQTAAAGRSRRVRGTVEPVCKPLTPPRELFWNPVLGPVLEPCFGTCFGTLFLDLVKFTVKFAVKFLGFFLGEPLEV